MPTVHLTDRALISVSGPEAEPFLQNILTTDLDALAAGEARPGALLTPQGKILFDFLISRSGDGLLLETRADIADDFIRRLMLYRLRAKVTIDKQDQPVVAIAWENESALSPAKSSVRDMRFGDIEVKRMYGIDDATGIDRTAYDRLRIAHGVAESGPDYALGDAFPHDVLLDQNGGVGFRKGCYVGQEVVSRMQHRGTARRRVLIAMGDAALPGPGTAIEAGGRLIGTLGTVAGCDALALARIDKVHDAMAGGAPITAEGVALSLSIPSWARFTWPAPDVAAARDA